MKLHKLTLLAASALLLVGAGCEQASIRADVGSDDGARQEVREETDRGRDATATQEENDREEDGLKAEVETDMRLDTGKRDREEGDDEREDDEDDDDRTGVTPAPTPAPAPAPTPTAKTYTMAQVKTHASAASCWTAIDGSVYDVTGWIAQHPGGEAAILPLCGIDGSAAFHGQHGGQARPASELAGFRIGVLAN